MLCLSVSNHLHLLMNGGPTINLQKTCQREKHRSLTNRSDTLSDQPECLAGYVFLQPEGGGA